MEEIVESALAACVYTHMYLQMFMCMCVYICIFIYIKETNECAKEKYVYIYIIHPFALPKKLRAVPLFLSLSLSRVACSVFRLGFGEFAMYQAMLATSAVNDWRRKSAQLENLRTPFRKGLERRVHCLRDDDLQNRFGTD